MTRKKELDADTQRRIEESNEKEKEREVRISVINEYLQKEHTNAVAAFAEVELKSDDPARLAKRLSAKFTWLQFNLSYRDGKGCAKVEPIKSKAYTLQDSDYEVDRANKALSKGWYPTVADVQLYATAYEEGFRDGERSQDGGGHFRRGPFMVPYPFGM